MTGRNMPMRLWAVAVIVLLIGQIPAAQNTFHVAGIVTDQADSPVPGATVTVSMRDRPEQEAVAGADGRFSMEIAGDVGDRFSMMFRMTEFQTLTRPEVVVPPNRTLVVNVRMGPYCKSAVDLVRGDLAPAMQAADAVVRLQLSPAVRLERQPHDCQFVYAIDPSATVIDRIKMRPREWRSKKAIPVMLIDEVSPEPGDEFIAFLDWNRERTQLVAMYPTAVSRGKLGGSLSGERGFGPGASMTRVMRALRSMCRKKSDGC